MYYFDEIDGQKVLKSNFICDKTVQAFFTLKTTNLEQLFDSTVLKRAERYIKPEQTHGDNIEIADTRNTYPDTDAVIITKPNVLVYLKFADCTPIILYDKKNKIGAVVHAGWRGTALKIGVKTAEKMSKELGSIPENITVLIGAAIGKCCYEVSDDVKDKILSTVKNSDGLFCGKKIDLKGVNARQFEEYGITNIDISPYCTSCNNDMFYSYRKENGTNNRHYAILML